MLLNFLYYSFWLIGGKFLPAECLPRLGSLWGGFFMLWLDYTLLLPDIALFYLPITDYEPDFRAWSITAGSPTAKFYIEWWALSTCPSSFILWAFKVPVPPNLPPFISALGEVARSLFFILTGLIGSSFYFFNRFSRRELGSPNVETTPPLALLDVPIP